MYFKKITTPLFLLSALLTLQACGKKEDSIPQGTAPSGTEIGEYNAEDLQNFKLTCKNPAECPQAVGKSMTLMSDNAFVACTAFLVTPDTVMTNAHCLRSYEKNDHYCKRTVFFFRKSPTDSETFKIKCQSVIHDNPDFKNDPYERTDFALVKLRTEPGIKPLKLNTTDGVIPNSSYTAAVVNTLTKDTSEMQAHHCIAKANTLIAPQYQNAHSANFLLKNCDVIPGNSGSPLLNARGEVVGLINQNAGPLNVKIGKGINLGCIKSDIRPELDGTHCDTVDIKTAMNTAMNAFYSGTSLTAVNFRQIRHTLNSKHLADPDFEWKYYGHGEYIYHLPGCYKNPSIPGKVLVNKTDMIGVDPASAENPFDENLEPVLKFISLSANHTLITEADGSGIIRINAVSDNEENSLKYSIKACTSSNPKEHFDGYMGEI